MLNDRCLFIYRIKNFLKMKTVLILGWDNGLQAPAYEKAHQAYLAAFAAAGTGMGDQWTLEDTIRQQGTSPAEIWANKDLWGEYSEKAKEAFYKTFNALPTVPLREGARALINATVFGTVRPDIVIVSAKSQQILEYEILELDLVADEVYGSNGAPISRVELLSKALAGYDAEEVLLVANASYKAAAEELGIEFREASTEVFRDLVAEYMAD